MTKLWRYYVPYLGGILLAILFLFIQANMDLALPDYMSRLVNVGIQQGGIEEPLPEAMRASTYTGLQGILAATGNSAAADTTAAIYTLDESDGLYHLDSGASNDLEDRDDYLKTVAGALLAVVGPQMQATGTASTEALSNMQDLLGSDATLLQAGIYAVRFEHAAAGVDADAVQSAYIAHVAIQMLLITLASAMATIIVVFIGARVSAGVTARVRGDLFAHVESFSAAEFDTFSTASLITRNTNDLTQVQMATFMIIRMVFMAPIMGIGGVIRALGKAPSMAWLIALAVGILLLLVLVVMSLAMPRFKAIQKLVDRLNRVAREQLSGLLVVRAFNRQEFEQDRFDAANRDLTNTNLFVMRIMVIMMPMIMLIMNLLSVGIIWIGADKVASATMQVGDMMAFIQYAMQIVMSFLMLTMVFIMLPRASVSAERIAEVLATKPSILNLEGAVAPAKLSGGANLEFRNVSFSYPGADHPAVSDLSFTAEAGKTTAIIGSTGSGKSTLVNLIPRFYDVCEGSILLDGVDLRKLDLGGLRRRLGYVPQKSVLFSGTIGDNLSYGDRESDEARQLKAAEVAQASDFINHREEGLGAPVSQGGSNLSGGQKQRLSIGRALVRNAGLYIFDDSFSALDFKTDAALRKALNADQGDATVLIVAQRVATILHADQILVLEDGKLVGRGTHDELLQSCEEYQEIVYSQLQAEEING